MKKFLFGTVALLLMVSCTGKGESEKTNEDSTSIADSIPQVETVQPTTEKAQQDAIDRETIRPDSIKKETEKDDFPEIQSLVKNFYNSCVIGCHTKTTKSHVSKYLTNKLISELIKKNEYGDGGVAVWYLRGDPQDCDDRDKVLSVEKSGENSVIVKFLDCGFTCKVRLDLVKEKGTWKINNYKFISQSNKSKYSEFNW